MDDTELLNYLQKNARNRLEVAYNFYEQKYKVMINHENYLKEKSKTIGGALVTVSAIVFSIKLIIFIIKSFVIKSKTMDLPMRIFRNTELLGFTVGLLMILGLLIYFGIIFGDYWYSTHYDKGYINEKNRYMAKASKIKRMLNDLDELNEDELSDIIRKNIEDF